ncbi:MAG: hypothetical protein ISS78_11760, partial [Phycisphaerae bacterium]|nr:hypothetical protein [Phycisphaerae bacterium]
MRSKSPRTLTGLLAVLLLAVGAAAQPKAKPKGRKQPRRDPLTIPQVTRDKVICFALYTVHNNILKLTAQLYPLTEGEDRTVRLEVKK